MALVSVETRAASIISKVGLWWPLAEEDQLRRAAAAYQRVESAVLAAAQESSGGATLVTGQGQQGAAVAAFTTHWAQFDGTAEAGLPATAAAAARVAAALRRFADEVTEAKRKIINLAIEIGASIAVGIGLALFTFGTSAGVAAARTAMLVVRGLTVAAGLSGIAATIVATMLGGVFFGAVEGFISGIVAQVATTVFSDGDGVSWGEAMTWSLWGAGTGGAFAGAGLAARAGFRALRHGDNFIADRLGAIRWGDETGSIGLGGGDKTPRPPERVTALAETAEGKKLRLTDPDDSVGVAWEQVLGAVDPQTGEPLTDIIIHGQPTGFAKRTRGDPVSPVDLAKSIKSHPDYDGGPIRLLGCRTGQEGATAAQELADRLGVRVYAPSDKTWIVNDRHVIVGDDQYGPYQNLGHWSVFHPTP